MEFHFRSLPFFNQQATKYENALNDPVAQEAAKNFTLELAPVSGDISNIKAVFTGETLFTQERLSGFERLLCAIPLIGDEIGDAIRIGRGVKGLTKAQMKNLTRFKKKVPANSKANINIKTKNNGDAIFEAHSPGEVPGSKAIYNKKVGQDGITKSYIKTTIDNKGNRVHVKDKLNNKIKNK